MTRQEAYEAMLRGDKVRHDNYSSDEYLMINKYGDFETEDEYTHGGIFDEFWTKYQKWEDGWELFGE